VAVGFGIRDGASARAVARIADAVVVGSRLVEEVEKAGAQAALPAAGRLIAEIRSAIDESGAAGARAPDPPGSTTGSTKGSTKY
jgi:tryptophan synthase alpha chain